MDKVKVEALIEDAVENVNELKEDLKLAQLELMDLEAVKEGKTVRAMMNGSATVTAEGIFVKYYENEEDAINDLEEVAEDNLTEGWEFIPTNITEWEDEEVDKDSAEVDKIDAIIETVDENK